MVHAIINNKGNNLLLDIPYKRTELYEQLASIGVWNPQGGVFIRDREDENVSVKLYGDTAADNGLVSLFGEDDTLTRVNTVCDVLRGLSPEQREVIGQGLMQSKYHSPAELLAAMRDVKVERLNVDYYCPLTINTPDENDYEMFEYGGSISRPSVPGLASWLKSKICVKGTCRNCPHRDCKYYRYISDANNLGSYDIQVTNHNLLMTSQMLKKGNDGDSILQKSNFCIIDEAHKLRETASTVFGSEIESDAVSNYFYSIKYDLDQDKSCSAVLRNCCIRAEQLNNELFRLVTLSDCDTISEDEPDRINFTYSEELRDVLNDLIHTLKRICQIAKNIPNYKSLQCNNLIASFEKFLEPEEILYWVDIDKASNTTSLCCEPKSLENNMRESLWSEPDVHYVLTSGTMKDDRGFEYFKNEIGLGNCLPSFKQSECSCDSPFDYSNHTRLYISENVGYPDNNEDRYINDLVDEIEKLIQATHGHTAILFTSYKVLSTVYDRIAPRLTEYPLLRMSKSNKNAISDFKKSKNGILFASGSMWEGVDCIGDILSSVIIVKLPFPLRTRVLEQKKKDCATMHEFIQTYAVP